MSGVNELPASKRPKSIYLLLAAGLGMVVGLLIGALFASPIGSAPAAQKVVEKQGVGADGETYERALAQLGSSSTAWQPAPVIWNRLGPFSKAGQAPKTFSIPSQLYDYGAMTDPIPSVLVSEDIILRVAVSDVKGIVGVSLVNPVGNPLVSEEQSVTRADGERYVFFRVRPKDLPASILVRNYGDQSGNKGSITVKSVDYSPASRLSDKEVNAIETIGLNKALM